MSYLRERALAFLASHHTIHMATIGPDGPRIAPLPYVLADEFDLWIVVDSHNAHWTSLDSRSAVAGMVRGRAESAEDIEIRIEGDLERVSDLSEQAKAFSTFLVRRAPVSSPPRGNGEGHVLTVYRVRPRRVHLTAPALLRHPVVFHAEVPSPPAPSAPPLRRKNRAERPRLELRDRPTLRDALAIPKTSSSPPS